MYMQMAIIGICGKMGSNVYEYYKEEFDIVGIDVKQHPKDKTFHSAKEILVKVDVVVDFSSPDAYELLIESMNLGCPILSGTTGYSFAQIEQLYELAKQKEISFLWKANYAKGIDLFTKLLKECHKEFEILDFVEIHATSKKDAPSGTAKVLARSLNISEDKIQSLRLNQAPAIHEIIFSSLDERVYLRHEILNKKAFLTGFDEELRKRLRS